MGELLYKDLSYVLNGIAFEIDNQIGFGQSESVYSKAFEEHLKQKNIPYEKEKYFPIKVNDVVVARKYVDFSIDGKIVVELKQGEDNYRKVCRQVFEYLKSNNLKLGLVIRFTKNGVKVKRIPCFY